jgi:hypothetical protein
MTDRITIRRLFAVALTALIVAGLPSVVSARSRPCRPGGSHTVASSGQSRAYRLRGHVYACLFARRHAYRLDVPPRFTDLGDFPLSVHGLRLSGQYTAYVVQGRSTAGKTESRVQSLNLLTGQLRTRNALTDQTASEGEATEFVRRLYLRPDGAIAWSADEPDPATVNAPAEIARLDAHGFSLLDQGPEPALDPATLRLSGTTLTWQHDGAPRTATLS